MRRAIEVFLKTIELNPKHKKVFANRCNAYRLTKRYEEALKDFDTAINLGETAWRLSMRAQIHQFLGYFDQSLQDLDRAI